MEPMTLTEAYDYFIETGKPISNDDVFDGAAMIFDDSKNLLTQFERVIVPTNPDFDDLTTWQPWEPPREYVGYWEAISCMVRDGKTFKNNSHLSHAYKFVCGQVGYYDVAGTFTTHSPCSASVNAKWYEHKPTDHEKEVPDSLCNKCGGHFCNCEDNEFIPVKEELVFDLTYEEALELAKHQSWAIETPGINYGPWRIDKDDNQIVDSNGECPCYNHSVNEIIQFSNQMWRKVPGSSL